MSEDIKVTDGTVLEALNGKVDLDGGNYIGSPLEEYIHKHCGGGLEIGDIGIAPLGIDETKGKRRYLNGQVIIQDQYVQFTNKVKSAVELYPSLTCTESEWQTTATMTVGGQVGKFVVDDNAGTIRLPKIIMPIQGLTDLSKLAEIVEAGLPTHTHTRGNMEITGYFQGSGNISGAGGGAFYSATGLPRDNGFNSSNTFDAGYRFAASRSWTGSTSTGNYSKVLATTDTVQQEQIQYPYFIQVATGAETEDNIINEIELNNPFSLLDYKYSEYELNNLSWLRSEGQYNSKITYPAVYDLLLKIYNGTETKAGVSVKSTDVMKAFKETGSTGYYWVISTETPKIGQAVYATNGVKVGNITSITSTNGFTFLDISGPYFTAERNTSLDTTIPYSDTDFVLNTTDETFRLPIKVKQKFFNSGNVPVVGNGKALGLTNGSTVSGLSYIQDAGNHGFVPASNCYGASLPYTGSAQVELYNDGMAIGVTTDASKSGLIAKLSNVEATGLYLYFYVGETVQNANLINAGRIEEVVSQIKADKLDKSAVKAYIVESYVNGTSWYNRYSNGWIEQGGRIVINSATVGGGTYNNTTLTFIKPFSKLMSWHCQAQHDRFNAGFHADVGGAVSSVNVYQVNDSTGSFWNAFVLWEAKGYIA